MLACPLVAATLSNSMYTAYLHGMLSQIIYKKNAWQRKYRQHCTANNWSIVGCCFCCRCSTRCFEYFSSHSYCIQQWQLLNARMCNNFCPYCFWLCRLWTSEEQKIMFTCSWATTAKQADKIFWVFLLKVLSVFAILLRGHEGQVTETRLPYGSCSGILSYQWCHLTTVCPAKYVSAK